MNSAIEFSEYCCSHELYIKAVSICTGFVTTIDPNEYRIGLFAKNNF